MDDKKLPKIDLTPKQIEEILKNHPLENFLPRKNKKSADYFRCEHCRDTKIEQVYGGPNRPCPHCGPKY